MISAYLWNKIARDVLRGEAQTYSSSLWLWLGSAPMAADGTGGTELPTADGWARVEIVCNTSNWAAPVGKEIGNGAAVPLPTPSADLPEVVYAALVDSASGAFNTYFHGEIPAFTMREGQANRSFDVGAIVQRGQ